MPSTTAIRLAFYDSKAALASARLVLADKSLLERSLQGAGDDDRPAGVGDARPIWRATSGAISRRAC